MIHGGQEPKLNTTHSISPPCPLPMPTSALDVTLDLPTQLTHSEHSDNFQIRAMSFKVIKMALTNAATVKWKNETVASTGRHVSTNFPNKSNSASSRPGGSHTKDSHINAPVWVARTSQIRQTHASTPTSLSYTPPDHDKLIRERDALEEELLLRYMQLRKMEQRFSLELEYRDRELEAIKLNVATARGANPASSNK
ncbi:hypothetical protein BSLG_002945 [Batrachochytrium salamandrivorans]|nr:hypothetical protein BSLG_002945 [Batrachochytrium salamandrivorans]